MSLQAASRLRLALFQKSPARHFIVRNTIQYESRRLFAATRARLEQSQPSNETPPSSASQPEQPRPSVRNFRYLARPFFKVFLIAMLSYQFLYWSWEKMRLDEVMEDKQAEFDKLRAHVEDLKNEQEGQKGR